MIQKLAYKITEYMSELNVLKESNIIHQYGVEVILSTIIDFSMTFIIGILSDHLLDSIIYCLLFWLIRKFSGGYHCQTYFKCISLHILLFIIYVCTYTYYYYIHWYVCIGAMIIFVLLSPIKNRKLEKEQYKQYKILSIFILLGYIMLSYIPLLTPIMTYLILIISMLMIICINQYERKTI